MNWFRQNRALGTFLVAFGLTTLAALVFLWFVRSRFEEAQMQFTESATELNRLEHLNPFPTEGNLEKMKAQAQDYRASVAKMKEDLKTHVLPETPLAPNEFQARLNQARTTLVEKARENKVRLPDNFFLGFEEFGGALPDTAAAPLLGQELAQVELLLNILIDAHVDAVTSLHRVVAVPSASPTPTVAGKLVAPAAKTPAVIERNVIDLAFAASPSAMRRVLNQIATVDQQFFILRTLHVLNEKEKGPPREVAGTSAKPANAASPTPANGAANTALNFIVGNEHLQAATRIEMVRFAF